MFALNVGIMLLIGKRRSLSNLEIKTRKRQQKQEYERQTVRIKIKIIIIIMIQKMFCFPKAALAI